jgi:hypothetical protein
MAKKAVAGTGAKKPAKRARSLEEVLIPESRRRAVRLKQIPAERYSQAPRCPARCAGHEPLAREPTMAQHARLASVAI